MSSQVVLFACSKCFSRHPFEELSTGQQLCKVNTIVDHIFPSDASIDAHPKLAMQWLWFSFAKHSVRPSFFHKSKMKVKSTPLHLTSTQQQQQQQQNHINPIAIDVCVCVWTARSNCFCELNVCYVRISCQCHCDEFVFIEESTRNVRPQCMNLLKKKKKSDDLFFLFEMFCNDVKIIETLAILIVVMTVTLCLTFLCFIHFSVNSFEMSFIMTSIAAEPFD